MANEPTLDAAAIIAQRDKLERDTEAAIVQTLGSIEKLDKEYAAARAGFQNHLKALGYVKPRAAKGEGKRSRLRETAVSA